MERLLNVVNEWEGEVACSEVMSPCYPISVEYGGVVDRVND